MKHVCFTEQKWKEDCLENISLKVRFLATVLQLAFLSCTFIFKTQLNQVVHSCMCHHSHIKAACLYDITINIYETGLRASLERLQLEYIDVVFANRPDPNTPIEGGCA